MALDMDAVEISLSVRDPENARGIDTISISVVPTAPVISIAGSVDPLPLMNQDDLICTIDQESTDPDAGGYGSI